MTDAELDACLAMLTKAATDWENGAFFCAHPVLLGIASPRSARVIRADHWGPRSAAKCDKRVLVAAVDSPASHQTSCMIMEQVGALLGPEGKAVYRTEAEEIERDGKIAMLCLMIPDRGDAIQMTVAIERPLAS